jgi:Fur family ferric uptake transcriptional regulator
MRIARGEAELAAMARANKGLPPLPAEGQTPAGRWAQHARRVVRRAGHNRGAAREAIIQLFADEECALSVAEIEARLESQRPTGRASMYRAIDLLHGLDLLARVDIGDGISRYERAHLDHEDHHHHMVCERCGLLMPFDDELLESAIGELSERLSFATKEHEVILRGVCIECT